MKEKLLDSDKLADIVAGPDAYRDLPRLVEAVQVSRHPLAGCVASAFEL